MLVFDLRGTDFEMDDLVTNKVSVSMRNAINVNSQRNHLLGKTVKHLEAERDLRLLNLQMKKDEVVFGSPSPRGRGLGKSSIASDGVRSGSQQDIYNLTVSSNKDEESTRFHKASNLPPLQLDQPSLIATPPRTRRATSIRMAGSPNSAPHSPLESYIPSHKNLTRQFSSSHLPTAGTNSTESTRELRRENSAEGKQQFSPRLLGSSTHPPGATSGVSQFDLPQRPRTASSSKDAAGSEVHRGLLLRPVSLSKEQTKAKEIKKASVFNRLYTSGKKRYGNKVTREISLALDNPKLEATRRRSISLPDLSEILDKLKTCRYLRDNSQ